MEYCIENYVSNNNPEHHDDQHYKDEGQKEVYEFCREFMQKNSLKKVIDVGCGSGYKLVNILGEFDTVGIETEPCYSILKNRYPGHNWLLSGEQEKNFVNYNISGTDVIICSDVIEHITDPDVLINYLLSFDSKYFIISSPCREILCNHPKFRGEYTRSLHGPPNNYCHVREWTMTELKKYLSQSFNIISSHYGINQIECQYHLLTRR